MDEDTELLKELINVLLEIIDELAKQRKQFLHVYPPFLFLVWS